MYSLLDFCWACVLITGCYSTMKVQHGQSLKPKNYISVSIKHQAFASTNQTEYHMMLWWFCIEQSLAAQSWYFARCCNVISVMQVCADSKQISFLTANIFPQAAQAPWDLSDVGNTARRNDKLCWVLSATRAIPSDDNGSEWNSLMCWIDILTLAECWSKRTNFFEMAPKRVPDHITGCRTSQASENDEPYISSRYLVQKNTDGVVADNIESNGKLQGMFHISNAASEQMILAQINGLDTFATEWLLYLHHCPVRPTQTVCGNVTQLNQLTDIKRHNPIQY